MQLLIALLTANYIHCSNQKYFEKKNENYDAKMKFLTQLLIALSAADSIFLISALFTLITRQSCFFVISIIIILILIILIVTNSSHHTDHQAISHFVAIIILIIISSMYTLYIDESC